MACVVPRIKESKISDVIKVTKVESDIKLVVKVLSDFNWDEQPSERSTRQLFVKEGQFQWHRCVEETQSKLSRRSTSSKSVSK